MKNHTKIFYFITFHTKSLTNFKSLCIKFDKIDGFTRVYDETRHLVLFGSIIPFTTGLKDIKSKRWYNLIRKYNFS